MTLSSVSEQLGAVVNPRSVIGTNAIINTSAMCRSRLQYWARHTYRMRGNNWSRYMSWYGAILKDRIKIGKNVIVGASAVVLKDIIDEL